MNTLFSTEIETVDITSVTTHPENARLGDINAIAESLRINGQFRPLVVDAATGHVLAGNHTLRAARDVLGWQEIGISRINVRDEEHARRILLADNRIGELGGYDDAALAELLNALAEGSGLEGTGYDDGALEELLLRLEEAEEEIEEIAPTEAAYAETEDEEKARQGVLDSHKTLEAQGLAELIVVLNVETKRKLIDDLDALRNLIGGEPSNGQLVAHAMTLAVAVHEAATDSNSIKTKTLPLDLKPMLTPEAEAA
ncbi:ParB N-terminal domain-containing protein [Streptomyces sp. CS014]|uniref:ParB N-terminal domain-containing protein n=1 Tax=Streptomyces sp. CS014 TaxID=2162707 RepID=UPI000D51826C|nr:ParB N-terminal domain-containing protein [Streptomyces sp. CS014]PVD04471.1 hypothetical protein DBP12_03330 [Streptomyces sp. CS014]